MPAYFAVVVTLTALLQGTVGSPAYLAAGVALAVPALFKVRNARLAWGLAPLALLSVWMVAASLAHGLSAEGLSVACEGFGLLAALLFVCVLEPGERAGTAVGLCFGAALVAVLGVLALAGAFNMGWVSGRHLLYGFGDANIAAAWFAGCVLAGQALLPRNRFLILALPFNVVGLLLTCSVIVIPLWLLAELLVLVRYRANAAQMGQLILASTACAFAVALYYAQGSAMAVLALLVLLAVWAWFAEDAVAWLAAHKAHWACAALMVVAVIVGTVFSQRVQVELPLMLQVALVEMGDALACIAANPLFGLGATQWNFLGAAYQSTVFGAAVVPNSYLHLAAEAGVVAGALALVLVVLVLVRAARLDARLLLAAVIVATTSLVTDALGSFALACLLMALCLVERRSLGTGAADVTSPDERRLPLPVAVATGAVPCVACAVALAGMFQVQLFCNAAGDTSAEAADICAAFANEPYWVQNSPSARSVYDQWLIYEVTSSLYEGHAAGVEGLAILDDVTQPNVYDLVARAYILGARYRYDEGFQILLEALEQNPYNASLYVTVSDYLENSAPSEELIQQALAFAEERGFAIAYTELSDEERALFAEARQAYVGVYGEDE